MGSWCTYQSSPLLVLLWQHSQQGHFDSTCLRIFQNIQHYQQFEVPIGSWSGQG